MPPTDRLLAAVEAFYSAPSHERPRDGLAALSHWDTGSLYLSLTPKFKTQVLHRTLIPASNTSFKRNVELGLVLNFAVKPVLHQSFNSLQVHSVLHRS